MPGATPPAPSVPLAQLASSELKELQDDLVCYEGVRRLGFVRGVLLPVRNALGNAARVGALLEDGPGPYNNREAAQVIAGMGVSAAVVPSVHCCKLPPAPCACCLSSVMPNCRQASLRS